MADNTGQNEQLPWLLKSNDVLRETVVYAQGEALPLAQEPLDLEVAGDTLSLNDVYDGLEPGRWVIVSGNRTDVGSASGVSVSELAMIGSVAQGSEPPYGAASPISCRSPASSTPRRQMPRATASWWALLRRTCWSKSKT